MLSAIVKKYSINPFVSVEDGLLPPTRANVRYWTELCRHAESFGLTGVANGQWPADLAPSKLTLKALQERGLLVRRQRAWHLKRDWQIRLHWLDQRAVPTPLLQVVERPAEGLPTFAEMEAWEPLCLWLDAQPHRRARLPFLDFDEHVADLLQGMRQFHLVRHAQGCYWVLSPTWKDRLLVLWHATTKAEGDTPLRQAQFGDPKSLVAGIDTWYLNRIDKDGLPTHLRMVLDELQQQAKDEEEEVETPWSFDDTPLRIYRTGLSAKQGGGASWAYLLRNNSLVLRIRRKPLGGIIAQAQFSSECLWRLTPRQAYKLLDRFIKDLWGRTQGQWQNSQVHLCHDVMNDTIILEQLDRYISRSRTQSIFDAARADIEAQFGPLHEQDLSANWDDIYGMDEVAYDPLMALGSQLEMNWEPVEERGITIYRSGSKLSGIHWSPGKDISLVQYLKTLEVQRTGKQHMLPLWEARGRDSDQAVVRYEARLRRGAMRDLRVPGLPAGALDDPLTLLDHLSEVFALVVGQSQECPEATDTAWLRRVIPNADTNRSRWSTDPVWRIVQSAPFESVPAKVRKLTRERQITQDIDRRVRVMYGSLVSAVALGSPEGESWDISYALRQFVPLLVTESEHGGKEFGELVRARKQKFGIAVANQEKILPLRSREIDQPNPSELDCEPEVDDPYARAWWHKEHAERRLTEALIALDQAQRGNRLPRQLAMLEADYQKEATTYAAALACISAPS